MKHDARQRDQSHDDLVQEMSVAEAADHFGITAGAVRKRLERKQLDGYKRDKQWRVLVSHVTRHDSPVTTTITTAAPEQITLQQLALIRDEWMQPLLTEMQAYTDRLAALSHDHGRALSQVESLTTERDQLRQQIAELRTQAETEPRPWWKFWA